MQRFRNTEQVSTDEDGRTYKVEEMHKQFTYRFENLRTKHNEQEARVSVIVTEQQ